MYDVTDAESFNNVKQWLHEIDRYYIVNSGGVSYYYYFALFM